VRFGVLPKIVCNDETVQLKEKFIPEKFYRIGPASGLDVRTRPRYLDLLKQGILTEGEDSVQLTS
jgi:hypothetical protein